MLMAFFTILLDIYFMKALLSGLQWRITSSVVSATPVEMTGQTSALR
jgi:hypothetical protein